MSGRVQTVILLLAVTLAAAILIAWTSGLFEFGTDGDDHILLEHSWRASGTNGVPEFHAVNLTFKVETDIGQISLFYKVDLPSDLAVGLPGSSEDPSPEVRLELLDGSGNLVWQDVFYTSARLTEIVNTTVAGIWTLNVWARAYGYEGETGIGTSVEFHDSIEVTVSAK